MCSTCTCNFRREKYLKYLGNIRGEIKKAANLQREILNENFPPVLSQIKVDNFYDMVLWSRVIGQKDFLTLRLGEGNVRLKEELSFPDQRFSIDDDVMRDEVNRLSEEKLMIAGLPVTLPLTEHRAIGIVGNSRAVGKILNNLFLQIAALHSYDEVKVVFLCEECDLKQYDYVRWMQHIWDNSFRMRYLATTPGEVRDLSVHFTRVMERHRGEKAQICPYYVIISTSKTLSDGCAFLNEFLGDPTVKGFSYLAVYDELKNLPKECTAVVQVNDTQSMLFDYQASGGAKTSFVQDMVTTDVTAWHVMDIAGYHLDLQSGKYTLPGMLAFLEMYRVGKYEHLNIATRWKGNNPVLSLRTPVGVNSDGDLFYLDLHENAHGPHGLVAGMTGSGKSEFIITYVLSMAMNYSPDDVAFILIDYKGGGLVGAFDNELYHLPHLAGTITNLDGAAINRSLLSIQSELRRRQAVFNEARRVSNEGTMDIYKYQKLYRNGVVKEPVPHLLIISDEFAELKTQQPEFMTQLISTARIGRSLGVHLILATQKPSGVVNDQIWANSKFKVCLKVQDRADSMDMLKRPDAAELVETGRFYLQVGYNELFELGQSAWCGAPYIPTDTLETELDERVQMIGHLGDVVEEAKPARKAANSGKARKQIVEIAQYITKIAEEEHLQAKPLWLPEIPAVITVEQLEEKYQCQADGLLNPVIGEVDDPFNQSQRLLTLPLSAVGNAICYGIAGSGKESFLIALLYSLYRDHSSMEVNTYILDFGAETLRMFAKAPQTGDVIVSNEEEKTASLFRYLQRETARRRKLFADLGGDYQSYCRSGRDDVPNIVVLINNYTNFAEQYELLDEQMVSLTRDCSKYGVYFVLTSVTPNGIRYRLKQNFPQVYVLQQNEKADYTSLLGNTGGVYPSQITGRGLYCDTDVYEFQTAYVTEKPEQTADVVRIFCELLSEPGQKRAKPVPMLPKLLQRGQLEDASVSFGRI
ncbi:MAG: type VII secretion protein EssC, partial [Lachnospiraceae bacterium]|nr:type VII secretion protein EssC [Lachnospiraceae bacterium]